MARIELDRKMKLKKILPENVTKGDVADKFKLLETIGFVVKNSGTKSRTTRGVKGKLDIFVAGHGYIHYVEVKIRKDNKLSDAQKKVYEALKKAEKANPKVFVWLATENNYTQIWDKIVLMVDNL